MSESEPKDFFELHGTELVSIGGWLGDPRFTVEELYQAFKARLSSELFPDSKLKKPQGFGCHEGAILL